MKLLTQILALIIISSQLSLAAPIEKGLASFYDDSFHGRQTASGEKYDRNLLTAAHKTLPFGTKVKIVNPANNKSVEVVINDRGPYIKGRIIEISKKAAQELDIVKLGVAQVEITVLSAGTTTPETKTETAATETETKTEAKSEKEEPKSDSKVADASKSSSKTDSKTDKNASSSKNKNQPKPEPKKDLVVEAQQMETGGLYKMQVLKLEAKGFGVQVAGYSDYQAVVQQLAVLQENWFKGATIFVDKLNDKPYYKIILGPLATKEEANSYCENLKAKYKMKDAFVVNIEELAAKK